MNSVDAIPYREPNAPAGTPPLLLFFYEQAVKDERASRDGPPVFVPVDYVKVVVAGSKGGEGPIYEMARTLADGTVKRDAQAMKRFGRPYEDWKAGRAVADAGTPLEQWPLMDVAMVAAFKAANVYTVQQLAGLSDSLLDTAIRRGGREWRAKALAWLDEARTAAGDVEARATIARQQEEIDELKEQVKQLLRKQNTPGFDAPKPRRAKAGPAVDVAEESDLRL